jgi:hypothetical protein
MIPEHRGSGSAPRIAPHPLLKSYYADESRRKRHVIGMRAIPASLPDRFTAASRNGRLEAPRVVAFADARAQVLNGTFSEYSAINPQESR